MTYITQSDLIDRYSQRMLVSLTDRSDEPTGQIDADVITEALELTDAMIDSYLAGRYVLPLGAVPVQIRDLAFQVAIYKLHIYQADPKIDKDYNMAVRTLELIQDGKVRLPIAGVTPKETGGSGARVTDRDRPMTEDNLKGYI